MHVDVIVVGGGITGLAAARALARGGADVAVLEAGDQVGGNLRSWRDEEGFLLEAGPNTLSVTDGALEEHLRSEGLAEEMVFPGTAATRRYVVFRGRPVALPSSPGSLIGSPLLSPGGKLKLLGEPFRKRGTDPDESVWEFVARRLGVEAAGRLVDPFVSGIYAGDPHGLSVRAAFPTLWEAEQSAGSVVRGLLKRRASHGAEEADPPGRDGGGGATAARQGEGRRRRRGPGILSFREGLATWPRALAAALPPDRIHTGVRISALYRHGAGGWRLEGSHGLAFQADALVLALPAHEAARLLEPLAPRASRALLGIPYAPVAVVHMAYRRADVEHPLDGFGMLCPGPERRRILGSLWLSSLFPGRVPEDHVLTTCFVGGARAPELAGLPDDALAQLVREEQADLLGAKGTPRVAGIVRWPLGIPQYTRGHLERLAFVERLEGGHPGLRVLGNWRGGVSVPASWANGNRVGEEVTAWLGGAEPAGR
jgi:protoporphyrinogen/coproporphyrinogen III oxidase